MWPDDRYLLLRHSAWGELVSEDIRDLLVMFEKEDGVTLTWHSANSGDTLHEISELLGLGSEWPKFGTNDEYLGRLEHAKWWKQVSVERWLAEHQDQPDEHLLWIDDDIDGAIRRREIRPNLIGHPQLTLLSPNTHTGLSSADTDRVLDIVTARS